MESKKITENFTDLAGNVKEFLLLHLDLAKLVVSEKLSRLMAILLITFALYIVVLFFLAFVSFAFIFWFRDHVGEAYIGTLIVAGFYLIVALFIYFFRTAIFVNPLVLNITKILLESKNENEQ